jgi:hypothetical protein
MIPQIVVKSEIHVNNAREFDTSNVTDFLLLPFVIVEVKLRWKRSGESGREICKASSVVRSSWAGSLMTLSGKYM